MATKQGICYNVLKRHGLLIAYSGKSRGTVSRKVKSGETFGQWRKRVLGPKVKDVTVYVPVEPAPQTRVATLQNDGRGEHVKKIFEAFGRFKDRKTSEAVSESQEEIYEQYSTIPKDTLRNVLASYSGNLESSLEEKFNRILNSTTENVDAEALFQDMLEGYNSAVRSFRELKGKHEG